MKSQVLFSIMSACLVMVLMSAGCSKCGPCQNGSEYMAADVILPDGFVVAKGLAENDFIDGWPKYIVCCKDGSLMTLVPETAYGMGAGGKEVNEAPKHNTTAGRYYIDVYEVSNSQFARFSDKMNWGCVAKDDPCLSNELLSTATPDCWLCRNWKVANMPCLDANPCRVSNAVQMDVNYFKEYYTPSVNDSHPARAVSFWEAWYYCRWVGKDLPTEAEWELAAKGKSDRMYPWGNIEPDSQHILCNYHGEKPLEDGATFVAPVAAYASGRSQYGCFNMAGNVWEWCKDHYDATQYSVTSFAKGQAKEAEMDREFTDAKGAWVGESRTVRGGGFTSNISDCRTTVRKALPENYHGMNVGFRGVLRVR